MKQKVCVVTEELGNPRSQLLNFSYFIKVIFLNTTILIMQWKRD